MLEHMNMMWYNMDMAPLLACQWCPICVSEKTRYRHHQFLKCTDCHMNQGRVPQFGNWEGGDDVPYTQYFENARRGKTAGKLINPNDPQEKPESFSQDTRVRPSDAYRPLGSPLRKPPSESPQHRYGDRGYPSDPNRKARRLSGGSEHSFEQSPLHSAYQPKSGSRVGVDSPSWERRGSSDGHGLAPNTPGRARARQRGGEIPGKGPEVPKFGQWDETDPSSADDFSYIFNKVREERQDGSATVPSPSKQSSYRNIRKENSKNKSKGWGCFGCFK